MSRPRLLAHAGLRERALLAFAVTALACGVWAGLARIGVSVVHAPPRLWIWHGPLMIHGVFGTLIALERAVASKRSAWFVVPALGALGVGAALYGSDDGARAAFVVAALGLVLQNLAVVRIQRHVFTWLLALGALVLAFASVALARGTPTHALVPAWMTFLVVTIAAERLELARLAQPSRAAVAALSAALSLTSLASALATYEPHAARIAGGGLTAVAMWLARYDIARRTVRKGGLPRFVGVSLLSGYVWLALGGALLANVGLAPGSLRWDAAIHAVLVGFVLSMVLAHAPIVLPAVARIAIPFDRSFYAPMALLHLSVATRVFADVTASSTLRAAGAVGHVAALVVFFVSVLIARRRVSVMEPHHAPT